jgi:hypothetical protein
MDLRSDGMEAALDISGESRQFGWIPAWGSAAEGSESLVAATWCFVALGIAVRLVRYLVGYPIWHDEAFLAANLWDRSYVDLLRPLDYGQIAPWLFLAIERTAVRCLGYSEPVLRLFPTICSLLSVPLFCHFCGRLLPRRAQLFSVAVFATSFYPIRHGAEIKPYASDLLAALFLLACALDLLRRPGSGRAWLLLTFVAPVCIALSYPAIFVAGGISIACSRKALHSDRARVRLGCMVYNLVLAASFLTVYLANAALQSAAMREEYRCGVWAEAFPPLSTPWAVPLWLLDVHAGVMMAYPVGDRHGGSALSLLCVIAGGLTLYQQKRKTALAALAAPFGLGLLAATLGRYPYGGAPRVMQYLAPSICLLMGLGITVLLARIPGFQHRERAFVGLLIALGVLGIGLIARDLVKPYRVLEDVQSREFARWFWTEKSKDGALACLRSDFGLCFQPGMWRSGMSAVYLFHQRMFSDRHRRGDMVSRDPTICSLTRPLRLVSFDHLPLGIPSFDRWLRSLFPGMELRRTETYVVQPGKSGETWLRDAYHVLELGPGPNRRPEVADGVTRASRSLQTF